MQCLVLSTNTLIKQPDHKVCGPYTVVHKAFTLHKQDDVYHLQTNKLNYCNLLILLWACNDIMDKSCE